MFLSVIVPMCDGRLKQLKYLLETFNQQDCDKDIFELILIKNKLIEDEKKIDNIINDYRGKMNIQILEIDAPDEPEEITEKDRWVKLWGMNDARNLGIENAGGDYIFILDMDFLVMPNFISRLKKFVGHLGRDVFVLYPKTLRLWDFNWKGSLKETVKNSRISDWGCNDKYSSGELAKEFDAKEVRFDYYYGGEGLHIMPRKLAKAISFNESLGYRQDPKVEFQDVIKELGISPLYEIKLYLFHMEHGSSTSERKSKGHLRKNIPRRNNNPKDIDKIRERIKEEYPSFN